MQVFSILASPKSLVLTLKILTIKKYAWILNKRDKWKKILNKLIQDPRLLVKVFTILASTKTVVPTLNILARFLVF